MHDFCVISAAHHERFVPSRESEVCRSVVTCPAFFFFVFRVNFDGNCGEYAVKGHRRKQTDILVSFVFPAVLET